MYHEKGNNQSRNIFDPAVSEGMIPVRGLARHLNPYKADDGRSRVGQIIKCVRHNGNTVKQKTNSQLAPKQQQIAHNPYQPRKHAVLRAYLGIFRILVIFYKFMYQKVYHSLVPFFLHSYYCNIIF